MTRGNQRELARAKNLKKAAKKGSVNKESGQTLKNRKERDAEVMREKQKKKDELAAAKAKDEAGTSKK